MTRYYNDGFDVLFETNGTGSLTRSYTHGARIDEILSSSDSKARLSDGLGSTRTLTDAAGQQTASYIYDVFGAIRSEVGTSENAYLFTGRELDSETGLYYYRNRYYNPAVGRFVTKDPIGIAGGINYYSYTLNNPINYIDPDGLLILPPGIRKGLQVVVVGIGIVVGVVNPNGDGPRGIGQAKGLKPKDPTKVVRVIPDPSRQREGGKKGKKDKKKGLNKCEINDIPRNPQDYLNSSDPSPQFLPSNNQLPVDIVFVR